MRTKQSKTAKILDMLATGKSVKEVAKKLDTSANYVYYVSWNDRKKKKAKAAAKPKKTAKKVKDTQVSLAMPSGDFFTPDAPAGFPSQPELPLSIPNPLDVQVGGSHYKNMEIQPIQYIVANDLSFLEGCIVKRITRWRDKGDKGIEDLEKIKHEIDLMIAAEKGEFQSLRS